MPVMTIEGPALVSLSLKLEQGGAPFAGQRARCIKGWGPRDNQQDQEQ